LTDVTEIAPGKPVDEEVRSYLSAGRKYYASDAEIRAAASVVSFYLNGRPGRDTPKGCSLTCHPFRAVSGA
jgi:hypothetical protein